MKTWSIPKVASLALLVPAIPILLAPTADTAGDCDEFPCGKAGQKVLICHAPPGNPGNAKTLCIEPDSATDHLANHRNDFCGPCAGGAVAAGREGDLSGEGRVGISDLFLLLAEWGSCAGPGASAADLDFDAVVGGGDLLTLVLTWD